MDSLGETIRKFRQERNLPLRIVAANLDIDQAILSKIERGLRSASRVQVLKLAEFFTIKESELLVAWLSDKLVQEVANEEVALEALQVAEEKVEYLSSKRMNRNELLEKLIEVLKHFTAIKKAWIFGSFSREESHLNSDLDLTIETDKDFSYFELAEVKHTIENAIQKKIDIGFMDSFKPFILESVKPDLKLIYER